MAAAAETEAHAPGAAVAAARPAPQPSDAAAPLAIAAAEREPLIEDIAALAGALQDPRARAPYEELAAAVTAGEVPPALCGRLERALELSLATGRARRLHGPQHEAALQRLFFQTPAGTAQRIAAAAACRALAALVGQRIDGVTVTAQAPGVVRLRLDTDRCQLTLEMSRDGVDVTALGVEI